MKGDEGMNETFAVMYVMNNQLYPVALTEEQNTLIQMLLEGAFKTTGNGRLNVIDKPLGEVVNLIDEKRTDRQEAESAQN